MKEKDVSELCQQVNQVAQQAVQYVQSPQFQNKVQQGVKKAVQEIKNTAGPRPQPPYQNTTPYQNPWAFQGGNYQQRVQQQRPMTPPVYPNNPTPPAANPQAVNPKAAKQETKSEPSNGNGYLFMGFVCLGILGLNVKNMIEKYIASPDVVLEGITGHITAITILSVLTILFFVTGIKNKRRYRRSRQYWKYLQGRKICPIAQLAAEVGRSNEYVIKDVTKLSSKKYLPESYLDISRENLIFGHDTYQKYSDEERQKEEARQRAEEESKKRPPEVNEMLKEGFEYIRQIREANDAIPGFEVSEKLEQLEEIIGKIFLHVEKHPKKLPEIRKFMQYYLPTTLKLVNAYREYEEQSLQGENIDQIKREICETLDTINVAFSNLLDNLFEDDAMDVISDISVLETMFAQEGLTGHDFRRSQDVSTQGETTPKENPLQ